MDDDARVRAAIGQTIALEADLVIASEAAPRPPWPWPSASASRWHWWTSSSLTKRPAWRWCAAWRSGRAAPSWPWACEAGCAVLPPV